MTARAADPSRGRQRLPGDEPRVPVRMRPDRPPLTAEELASSPRLLHATQRAIEGVIADLLAAEAAGGPPAAARLAATGTPPSERRPAMRRPVPKPGHPSRAGSRGHN